MQDLINWYTPIQVQLSTVMSRLSITKTNYVACISTTLTPCRYSQLSMRFAVNTYERATHKCMGRFVCIMKSEKKKYIYIPMRRLNAFNSFCIILTRAIQLRIVSQTMVSCCYLQVMAMRSGIAAFFFPNKLSPSLYSTAKGRYRYNVIRK